jgi:4'-phosphopantetheinyl transferase
VLKTGVVVKLRPPATHIKHANISRLLPQLISAMLGRYMPGNEKLWSCTPTQLRLLPGDVEVWAARLDLPSEEVSELRSMLSIQECERAARFVAERDRARFVTARGYLRMILGACLGTQPEKVEFTYSLKGKPLLGGSFAGSGVQFNLAHSGGLAVFAVARHGAVGVDVEQIRPVPDLIALIERFFSARECAQIKQLPVEEHVRGFFQIWTRKEAWLKATGEGLTDLLNTIEVLDPPGGEKPSGGTRDGLGGIPSCLHELALVPGYLGALAVIPN